MAFTGKATTTVAAMPELADDVSDLVGLISPFDTPLIDAIGNPRAPATGKTHLWTERAMPSTAESEERKMHNMAQIFTETVTISSGMDALGLSGVEREFDYQVIQRLRELMRLLENSVINGKRSDVKNTTMGGILEFLAGNFVSSAANAVLTEDLLNAALKRSWEVGGRPSAIICNGFQKREISSFIQSSRRYEPESTTLRNLVDVYESDYGVQRVILSRWVPADKVLLLDLDKIQIKPVDGRSFFVKPLVESGDFRRAQIIGEYTLEITNAADGGHGVITDLATA